MKDEKEEKEESGKKSNSTVFIVICIVLFIAFIGIGFAVSFMMPKAVTEKREIDVTLLKSEVNEINELASLQYDYREVIQQFKTNSTTILNQTINTGRSGFIATFDGIIKAGVDLNDVDYKVDNPESGSEEPPVVTVSLPDAKILSHEDKDPKTLYEEGMETSGIGSIRNAAIMKKKQEIENEFIAAGNLDKAKVQSQEAIEDFIHSVYGDDINVHFQDK